jgi:hypothetical protein
MFRPIWSSSVVKNYGCGNCCRLYLSLSLSLSLILRPTVSRPVCLAIKHPSGAYDQLFYYCQSIAGVLMWGAISDERTGLSFIITAGLRQHSHFLGPSPVGLVAIFYYLRFETSPFRRLLRLAGFTVEVLDPTSTRESSVSLFRLFIYTCSSLNAHACSWWWVLFLSVVLRCVSCFGMLPWN